MDAVVVQNAYKQFGGFHLPVWRSVPRLSARSNRSGETEPNTAVVAVDHVSFTIAPKEIFGILGPHGSGKTTLIRMLATLLIPDGGDLKIFGFDVVHQPGQVQQLINRVSVEASFFQKLSPVDNLVAGARSYGIGPGEARSKIIEILARLGLDYREMYLPMGSMSRSMQQKVTIARAILAQPRLLLLDGPTQDLEPEARLQVHALLQELRDHHGTTIFLTTRDRSEAFHLCDRVAVVNQGKIIALDTPAALKHRLEFADDVISGQTRKLRIQEEV